MSSAKDRDDSEWSEAHRKPFYKAQGIFFLNLIRNLRKNMHEIPADVSMVCAGGVIVQAHSFVLQAVSKYFQGHMRFVKSTSTFSNSGIWTTDLSLVSYRSFP